MPRLIIIGFMATGKTFIGRRLAELLGYAFLDTDQLIEARTGLTVPQIFAELGEAGFRRLEREVIGELEQRDDFVAATGGGMAADADNLRRLKALGKLICLTSRPEVILARIRREGRRPLLQVADPLSRIRELLSARQPYYSQADFTLDTSDIAVEEAAVEIKRWVDRNLTFS